MRKHGAYRWKKLSVVLNMAYARSILTQIAVCNAWCHSQSCNENKAEFDPRKFLKPAMEAMEELCADRFERFGTAGNAHRINLFHYRQWQRVMQAGS